MITEDYVSFETAKILKEKGFDNEYTNAFYDKTGDLYFIDLLSDFSEHPDNDTDVAASTLYVAMKWLREVHNCPIEILWHWNADSQCSEWYFRHYMELKLLPQIQYYDTYEEACEAAIKYCLENLI